MSNFGTGCTGEIHPGRLDRIRSDGRLLFAHRLSTVMNADQILVMDAGQTRAVAPTACRERLLRQDVAVATAGTSNGNVRV
jgi:ABC-type transport system involved in Fe-S cluster assembly fused permease/ATPase subunit